MSSSQVLPQARLFEAEHAAKNREWRLAYLADRRAALPWLRRSGQLVDTGQVDAREAARIVAASVGV